jgi:tight adherence protein B
MTAAVIAAMILVGIIGWRWRPRPTSRGWQPVRRRGRRRLAGRPAVATSPGRRGRPWRRVRPSTAALADYLAAIARELRGGGTVTAAFLAVTPVHPGGTALLGPWREVCDGMPLVEALRHAPHGSATEVAIHSLSCAAAIGGSAAVSIDAAASVLRERDAIAAEARAQSAQARLSGRVLTIVPIGFAAWSAATDERIRRAAFSTAIGAAAVTAGLVLNAAGWWWMRRIVDDGGGR